MVCGKKWPHPDSPSFLGINPRWTCGGAYTVWIGGDAGGPDLHLGETMRRNGKSSSSLPWVDIFSGQSFQGRLTRLWGHPRNGNRLYKGKKLPRLGSIIVGPGAIADLAGHGGSRNIRLSQLTVLADASRLTNGHGIHSLRIAAVHS
jgi:hypothetical protein